MSTEASTSGQSPLPTETEWRLVSCACCTLSLHPEQTGVQRFVSRSAELNTMAVQAARRLQRQCLSLLKR